VMHLIHADRVIARPLAVVQAVAQGERPFMESCTDGQDENLTGEVADGRL